MAELKPCPFCGGEAYIDREDCYGVQDDYYMVHCEKCSLQFGFCSMFESEEEAIEAWNRRADNEAEPVKHGRWKSMIEPLGWDDTTTAECSVCGESWVLDDENWTIDEVRQYWHYCPSCGAKMDLEDEA